jgi:hypothetical protein
MKKDILLLPMEDVSVVAKPLTDDFQWQVLLINHSEKTLKNIMVASTGSGLINESVTQTSTLRHSYEELLPGQNQLIERIDPSVFGLENEYWVSCWVNDQLLDKRFVFEADSIDSNYIQKVAFFSEEVIVAS